MQHKLINIGDYLLIVDDTEIKEGDWIIGEFAFNGIVVRRNVKHYGTNKTIHNAYWTYSGETHQQLSNAKKIISHLPLNNSPILEGVDLLPSLEDDNMPVGFSTLEQWYNPKTNKAGYSLPEVTGLNDNDGCYMVHSVITNSQGLTQWVGEYIY